ncbi:MAG: PHB accumulation regulatory domain-containing protein, partial [Burkholderiales bacterium]
QFMAFQGPAMQSLVSSYMDQSRNMFVQMQQQVQNQTRNMFTGFGFPGYQGPKEDATQGASTSGGTAPEGEKKS